MKKFVCLILALSLSAFTLGCGEKKPTSPEKTKTTTETKDKATTEKPAETK